MDGLTEGRTVSKETVVRGIDSLPDEILIEIFSYLRLSDLTWCSHTCRRWRALLRQERALWRRGQCALDGGRNVCEVLATAGAVPRLETLYLLYSCSFGIRIAWPEATVFHHYGDAPLTWEPYFRCFDTECLVIDHSMQKNIFFYLSWVDRLTLKRIFVVEHSYVCRASESPGPVREAAGADGPLRRVGETHRDRSSGRHHCRGSGPDVAAASRAASGADGATCPALEEVNVYSKYIWDEHLERLCGLGPVRSLRVRCQRLRSLTFVRRCCATLQDLVVSDCRRLLEDAFADLRCLRALRVLRLADCRVEASAVADCVAALPHLESCLVNGRDILRDSP